MNVSNQRLGVTLLELMMAITVVAMLMVGLAGLSMTVQDSAEFNQGYGEASQHARLVRARITRTVNAATATEERGVRRPEILKPYLLDDDSWVRIVVAR